MVDRKLQIEVELDADGAVRGIRGLDDAIDRTKDTTDTAAGSFSKFQASIVTINQAVELAGRAFDGLSRVAGFAIEQLTEGVKVEGLARSFDNLQQSIGQTADDKLQRLQTATKGTISSLELMEAANNAVLLGVDKGQGEFDDLAAAAVKLGQATGRTATESLSDLVTGIGRASPLILDNLGITVKAAEAQQLFADKLEIATSELTEQQKASAFQEAAIIKIRERTKELADVQDNAGLSTQRLQATFSDLTSEFQQNLVKNADARDALNQLDEALGNVDVKALADAFASLISVMADVAAAAISLGNSLAKSFSNAKAGVALFTIRSLGKEAFEAAKTVEALTRNLEPNAERLEAVARATNVVIEAYNDAGIETANMERAVTSIIGSYDDYVRRAEDTARATRDATAPLKDLETNARETAAAIGNVSDSVGDLGASTSGAIKVVAESLQREAPKIISASRVIGEESGNTFSESFSDAIGELFGDTDSNLGANLADDLARNIGTALSNAIGGALDGSLDSETLGGSVGAIGGQALGAKLGGPIGAQIGSQIGSTIGENVFGAISDAFGGNTNAAANARAEFFNFLQATFDANGAKAIIEGELVELSEAFTGISRDVFDPGGGGFDELFRLSPDVQASFLGVGEAITQVLQSTGEFTDLVGGQVSAVLADRLGGDLNALQVLVSQLGLSFEELEEAMVSAAQSGEISFLEAQTGLQKLGQIAEEGIPGQIGAIDTAFDNMKKAGVQGGAATIDALKDIGAEAVELGINTIPELEQALINSGVAADDVAKFMEALAETGITSVSALADATNREAIQALADLQSQSFAFEEAFNQSVDRVIEKLERIPEETTTTVKVRVQTEAVDATAQQLVDSGGLGLQ